MPTGDVSLPCSLIEKLEFMDALSTKEECFQEAFKAAGGKSQIAISIMEDEILLS